MLTSMCENQLDVFSLSPIKSWDSALLQSNAMQPWVPCGDLFIY